MPNPIKDKTIVLGVTGSIAAYKAAEIASKLHQQGAKVPSILTEGALHFISPLTFQSVTGDKSYTEADLWGGEGHVTHIGLGRAADLLLIAPVSANTLARLAHGLGDNLLSVTALASHCPLVLAPAMDSGMYDHLATQENVEILRKRGAIFIGPESGHLASGLVGPGRMTEPLEIVSCVRWVLGKTGPLAGKEVIVTAGGTQEPIDPVRIITNRSSGKQGYAVAQAALDAGAHVKLITCPTNLAAPYGAEVTKVQSAEEMYKAVLTSSADADVLIMAAAVADFRPTDVSEQKIKKNRGGITSLALEPTTDILAAVAETRQQTGFPHRVVGFAAETQSLLENAAEKMTRKQLDMIVANNVSAPQTGFEHDTNQATLLFPSHPAETLPLMSKAELADQIIARVIEWFAN
jgi:phosphopantothenoylcysteine decarboxylase/phosphopantothenate--cysteine ligase